jgi:hypothetical protein
VPVGSPPLGETRNDVVDAPGSRFHAATRISRRRARALLSAESEHDARERTTNELDAPSASQALGCCKHESSSRAAGVALPLSDKSSDAARPW